MEQQQPRRLSASALEVFDRCQGKWGYKYLDGLPDPGSASTRLGTQVHTYLERYLQTGERDLTCLEGQIAQPGLRYLPPPGVMTIEGEFNFLFEGVKLKGFIDAFRGPTPGGYDLDATTKRSAGTESVHVPAGVPLVLDHKTTAALKWRKTADQLAGNIQALIYAKTALIPKALGGYGYETAPAVHLRWVYYQTRGGQDAAPTDIILPASEVEKGWQEIRKKALTLYDAAANAISGDDLPKNPEACKDYGGCPFWNRCNLPRGGRFAGLSQPKIQDLLGKPSGDADHKPKAKTMPNFNADDGDDVQPRQEVEPAVDVMSLFKRRKATPTTPATPAPAVKAATPAPAATQTLAAADPDRAHKPDPITGVLVDPDTWGRLYGSPRDGSGIFEKDSFGRIISDSQARPLPAHIIQTQRIARADGSMVWLRPVTAEIAGLMAAAAERLAAVDPQLALEPTEFQDAPDPELDEEAPALADALMPSRGATAATTAAAATPATAAAAAAPAAAPATEKPRRGRPPKNADKVAAEAGGPAPKAAPKPTPEPTDLPSVAEYHQGAQGEPAPEPTSKRRQLVLFVGCFPVKSTRKPTDLSHYVNLAHKQLSEETQGKLDHWACIEFGKGRGWLSGSVKDLVTKDLANGDPLPITLYLPRGDESAICYADLWALADLVVSSN